MEMEKPNKKTVFIAHPVNGDVQGNVGKILGICKQVHSGVIIPIVPYLVSLQYLDDKVEEDRNLGIAANHEAFYRGFVDELWLFGDCISTGMEGEVRLALDRGIPIIPQTEGTKRDFTRFLESRKVSK